MAYYAYLLQSSVDSDLVYIGMTNKEPAERLRRHNGELRGGAAATRSNRPWRIVCVLGPIRSKLDALAVEFAWQHPRMPPRSPIVARRGLLPKSRVFTELRRRAKLLDDSADTKIGRKLRILATMMTITYFSHDAAQRGSPLRLYWSDASHRRTTLEFAKEHQRLLGWDIPLTVTANRRYIVPDEVVIISDDDKRGEVIDITRD